MSPRDALLPDDDVSQWCASNNWELQNGKITRQFVFANFSEAFAFMTRVALLAEKLDHHPDWSNSWNRVVIEITSHDSGGITQRCLQLAQGANDYASK